MQEIVKLLNILGSVSDKSNILIKSYKPNSLEYKLLNKASFNKSISDRDAALDLYGVDQTDIRYKMLKHRIKRKLYNYLLTAELNNAHDVLQKEQECLRLINLSKLLLRKFQFDIALGLSNKIKNLANTYEFNEIVLNALEIESLCLSNNDTFKKFIKVKEKEKSLKKIVNLEKEAISMYQTSKVLLRSTVKIRKKHLQELPQILNRLKSIWDSIQSFEAYNAFFRTSILNYELNGDFGEIIRITEEADEFIKSGKVNSLRFDQKYNAYILVYAHLRNKSFERGLKYAEKFTPYFDETTLNWFSYMENYFLLALHAKQYELSSLLLRKVQDNSQYKELRKNSNERWQLYYTYLYFLKPDLLIEQEFKYQKFFNSFTGYTKDKQGFNVAILILQFIHFLNKNDSEALFYRIESLKKYSSTHLNDASSLRSRLFLKLLMLTVTEDFDAEACRIKGAKSYQKLSETPTPGDAYAEIEIIPYEHLWEMILDILEERN